jgi:hypothetical protein
MPRAKSLFHSASHAIHYCARSIAKNAVQEELRAQGVRVSLVRPAEITQRARAYLEQHPELYQQAFERAKQMGLLPPMITPDTTSAIFSGPHALIDD